MGATCELRQITGEEATSYVQQPVRLVEAERAKQEEFKKLWQVNFDFDKWNNAHKQRSYDWIVLVKGLVSFSKTAHSLVVHDGQPIGGLEESWELGGIAKVLSSEQVLVLYQVLAPVSVSWTNENFSGHAEMFEDFQNFLKEAAETRECLQLEASFER